MIFHLSPAFLFDFLDMMLGFKEGLSETTLASIEATEVSLMLGGILQNGLNDFGVKADSEETRYLKYLIF